MPAYTPPTLRRIPWYADGSQAYESTSGINRQLTSAQIKAWADDGMTAGKVNGNSTWQWGSRPGSLIEYILFPAPRDITGVLFLWSEGGGRANPIFQYSTDTVGPGSGTWPAVPTFPTGGTAGTWSGGFDAYRKITSGWSVLGNSGSAGIVVMSPVLTGVLGFRILWTASDNFDNIGSLLFYGNRSASDTSRQVAFCDSTGARFTHDQDFGDAGQGSTYKWKTPSLFNEPDQLYVKNFGSQVANAVVVSSEVVADDSGNVTTMQGETTFSLDDVTYTTTITTATMAAGAMVGPIFVKYASVSTDPIGLQAEALKVAVGSWT